MSYSSLLLQNITKADLRTEPFAYAVKDQTLDETFYQDLLKEYPDVKELAEVSKKGHPSRLSLGFEDPTTKQFLKKSPSWSQFMASISSRQYLEELLDLFQEPLAELYPQMLNRRSRLVKKGTNRLTRFLQSRLPSFHNSLYMEGNFNLSGDGYEVGPHRDKLGKLFVGLIYFRTKQDSTGGEFLVLKEKSPSDYFFNRNVDEVDERLEIVETIPFAPNHFCVMLNTKRSLHAVTRYHANGEGRRFVYVDIGTNYPLF